jgi:uncharacterized protein involved in exopolysaccharide biosynthesis
MTDRSITPTPLHEREELQQNELVGSQPRIDRRGSSTFIAVQVLWSERRLLLRSFFIGFVLAVIIAFIWPKGWKSTARLMPPEQQNPTSMLSSLLSSSKAADALGGVGGLDFLQEKNSAALFAGILRSRTVQDGIINKFDLRRVYHVPTYELARKILDQRTDIVEDRRSGIITVTVMDRDPNRARDICNTYIDKLNVAVATLSTSAARRERIFLEERLHDVKADLDDASRRLSTYSSNTSMIDMTAQGKAMLDAAATVEGRLIAAQSELRGLEAIYTSNNVRVRAARARVDELRRQMATLSGTNPNGGEASNPLEGTGLPNLRQLPKVGLTYADLYRRTKIEEVVFETLTKQYELAKVQEAKEIPTVRVLDTANLPEKKDSPKRMQVILALTILSFMFVCGWVLARDRWEQLDVDDPRRKFMRDVSSTFLRRTRFRRDIA